jgi:4-hydroxybenzoate polyprenyltransferase
VLCLVFIALFGVYSSLGWIYYTGLLGFAGLIVYEHSLVSPDDISRVNIAFFNVNGIISIGIFAVTLIDLMV